VFQRPASVPPPVRRSSLSGVAFLVRIFAWKVVLILKACENTSCLLRPLSTAPPSLLYNNVAVLIVMVTPTFRSPFCHCISAASKFNFKSPSRRAMTLGATKTPCLLRCFCAIYETRYSNRSLMVFIPAAGAYIIPEVVGGKSSEMLETRLPGGYLSTKPSSM